MFLFSAYIDYCSREFNGVIWGFKREVGMAPSRLTTVKSLFEGVLVKTDLYFVTFLDANTRYSGYRGKEERSDSS